MSRRFTLFVILISVIAVSGCTDQNQNRSILDGLNYSGVLNSTNYDSKNFVKSSNMENVSGFFNKSLIVESSSAVLTSNDNKQNISMRVLVFSNSSIAKEQSEKVLGKRLTPDFGQSIDLKGVTVTGQKNGFSYADSISRESDMVYSVEVVSQGEYSAYDKASYLRKELGREIRRIEEERNLTPSFEVNTDVLALYLSDLDAADDIEDGDYSLIGGSEENSNNENITEKTERTFVAANNSIQPQAIISRAQRFKTTELAQQNVEDWRKIVNENYTVEKFRTLENFPSMSMNQTAYKLFFRPSKESPIQNVMIIGRKQDVTYSVLVSGNLFYEKVAEQLFRQRTFLLARYNNS